MTWDSSKKLRQHLHLNQSKQINQQWDNDSDIEP
jgi:hypothetical protein